MCININILFCYRLLEWTSLYLAFQHSASPHSGHQHLPVGGCYLSSPGCRAENTSIPCPFCVQVRIAWVTLAGGLSEDIQRCAEGWRVTQSVSPAVALMAALKQVEAVMSQAILAACKIDKSLSASQNALYRTPTGLLPCPAGMVWKQTDWSQQAPDITVKGTVEVKERHP